MTSVIFKLAIPANERPRTHALYRAVTGTDDNSLPMLIKGGKEAEGVWEQGVEENIWT